METSDIEQRATEQPIYLDYAATTPLDPLIWPTLEQCLTVGGDFGNPSSFGHLYGQKARERVEHARGQLAQLMGAAPSDLIWTSGATESNNLALIGCAKAYQDKGRHLITMSSEHPSILETFRYLETQGFQVTYLDPNGSGLLDLDQLKRALHSQTTLVSIMHANNETGVIQDIEAIGELVHLVGAKFHVDAAQTVGKVSLDLRTMPVDLLSISGHKFYAPKGVGALFIRQRPRARVIPLMQGGGQERGLRSGTLPTHQIVALGHAAVIAADCMPVEGNRIRQLKSKLMQGLFDKIPALQIHGTQEPAHSLPNILNVAFHGVDAAALRGALKTIAVSAGSACHSSAVMPSHVLTAMGVPHLSGQASIRFSLGRWTTEGDIEQAIAELSEVVHHLRSSRSVVSQRQPALA